MLDTLGRITGLVPSVAIAGGFILALAILLLNAEGDLFWIQFTPERLPTKQRMWAIILLTTATICAVIHTAIVGIDQIVGIASMTTIAIWGALTVCYLALNRKTPDILKGWQIRLRNVKTATGRKIAFGLIVGLTGLIGLAPVVTAAYYRSPFSVRITQAEGCRVVCAISKDFDKSYIKNTWTLDGAPADEDVVVEAILKPQSRSFIKGRAGIGKSTFLTNFQKQHLLRPAEHGSVFLLVQSKDLGLLDLEKDVPPTKFLNVAIDASLKCPCPPPRPSPGGLPKIFRQAISLGIASRSIIAIDGLDEVRSAPRQEAVCRMVEQLLTKLPKASLLLASRPPDNTPCKDLLKNFTNLEMQPYTTATAKMRIDQNRVASELTKKPQYTTTADEALRAFKEFLKRNELDREIGDKSVYLETPRDITILEDIFVAWYSGSDRGDNLQNRSQIYTEYLSRKTGETLHLGGTETDRKACVDRTLDLISDYLERVKDRATKLPAACGEELYLESILGVLPLDGSPSDATLNTVPNPSIVDYFHARYEWSHNSPNDRLLTGEAFPFFLGFYLDLSNIRADVRAQLVTVLKHLKRPPQWDADILAAHIVPTRRNIEVLRGLAENTPADDVFHKAAEKLATSKP